MENFTQAAWSTAAIILVGKGITLRDEIDSFAEFLTENETTWRANADRAFQDLAAARLFNKWEAQADDEDYDY